MSRIGKFFGLGRKSKRRRVVEKMARFRERTEVSYPVPSREVIIAWICGINLVFTPWAVGGYAVWAQVVSALLAMTAFAYLFLPVGENERLSATPRESLAALVRCAPFWCGLLLAVLFLVQGLNPEYSVMFDGGSWLLMPEVGSASALPRGVAAPFSRDEAPGGMNAFRTLLILISPWLTFSALWCGIRSRRCVLRLGALVALSGVALALFALAMRASVGPHFLHFVSENGASAFGPFLYQNQAGAFFALLLMITASVALGFWIRASEAGRRSGAYDLLVIAGLIVAVAVPASFSFGALISLMAGLPVVILTALVCRHRLAGMRGSWSTASTVQLAIVAVFMAVALVSVAGVVDLRRLSGKVSHKMTQMSRSTWDDRAPIREATLRMYADASPVWGRGAGSYRWVSPKHFAEMPEFCDANGVLNRRASHAHCDWLQMLAEWGAAGLAVVTIGLVWFLVRVRGVLSLASVAAWPVFVGLIFLGVHAGMDCLLFNPAIALYAAFAAFLTRFLTDHVTIA